MTAENGTAAKPVDKTNMLSCWKDIAHYMGRSVRTVQRWEQQAGLPVLRPASHGPKSQILLDRREADAWMASRSLPVTGSRRGVRVRASRRTARLENDLRAARRLLTAKQALTEQVNRHVLLLKTQSALMLKLSLDMPGQEILRRHRPRTDGPNNH